MLPYIAGFDQIGYVTTDIARAGKILGDFGIPDFHREVRTLSGVIRGQTGSVEISIALANVGGVQVELIQPVSGLTDFYTELLPRNGDFGLAFHHVRVRVTGTLADWARTVSEIDTKTRPIALDVREGDNLRVLYVDDRAHIGHYMEYVWQSEAYAARRKSSVPRFEGSR